MYKPQSFDLVKTLRVVLLRLEGLAEDMTNFSWYVHPDDEKYLEYKKKEDEFNLAVRDMKKTLEVASKITQLREYEKRYRVFKNAIYLADYEEYKIARDNLESYVELHFTKKSGSTLGWSKLFRKELDSVEEYFKNMEEPPKNWVDFLQQQN